MLIQLWETLGNPKRPRGRAPTAAKEVDETFQRRATKLASHEQACERLTALFDDDGTRGSQAAAQSPTANGRPAHPVHLLRGDTHPGMRRRNQQARPVSRMWAWVLRTRGLLAQPLPSPVAWRRPPPTAAAVSATWV